MSNDSNNQPYWENVGMPYEQWVREVKKVYLEALYLQRLFKLKGKARKEFRRKHFADNYIKGSSA